MRFVIPAAHGGPKAIHAKRRCEITIISFSRSICRGGLAALIGVTGKPYPSCLSCHSHPIRPCGAPSPRGEGHQVKRQNVLGSPSGELPEGLRGLRSGIARKCWNIDSIGRFNIARYTASMPHLATLEMASHWILGRYAPKNPVRLHILPSVLPPKGEARRYAANDFLNLIELPRGEGCDARIPSSKKAAKPLREP